MIIRNKVFALFAILCCLNNNINNFSFAQELTAKVNKYPDYAFEYVGNDKYEKFNRKMFNFNSRLNKYAIRPVHTVWVSVMPKYGIERIQSAYTNIEYPKRLVSSLIQKDFKTSKNETVRFLTNTTIGLGGLYDPAKKLLKIEPAQEDMDQALSKCKIKPGPYLVIPVISSSSPRALVGRILDIGLNPSSYVATPVLAIVKAGLLVNRTSYMQPIVKMLESTYADPYDIAKKLYGIQSYIQSTNLDRKEVLDTTIQVVDASSVEDNKENVLAVKTAGGSQSDKEELSLDKGAALKQDEVAINEIIKGGAQTNDLLLKDGNLNNSRLFADLMLFDYNPQTPVVDAMRTALFDLPEVNNSIWSDISVWNRCFCNKIKTSSVNIDPERDNYKYKYIMQKDKNSPVAIIYPSIGEGIASYHSVVLAKLFYDKGYSVIIQGSHFQWEFVKSMPKDYRPGVPAQDADYLKIVTSKIINSLQSKYDCQFNGKVVIGTSFGALTTLFLAEKESKNDTMGITKYISINPPIELMYAMKQIDRNTEEWNKNPSDLKNRVAITAAKVIQVSQLKDKPDVKIDSMPFTEDEAKLITGFIMHQKLSDLVYAIENDSKSNIVKTDFYNAINNMNYNDYAQKYLSNETGKPFDELTYETSLFSIKDYLQNNDNYKIYHSLDDYLVNTQQLKQLKSYSGNKTVLLSNGSHLGFLYRQEFIDSLKKDITFKNEKTAVQNAQ